MTWNQAQGPTATLGAGSHRLRGCIGTLEPRFIRAGAALVCLTWSATFTRRCKVQRCRTIDHWSSHAPLECHHGSSESSQSWTLSPSSSTPTYVAPTCVILVLPLLWPEIMWMLCTGLQDYALKSALQDHRFRPMSAGELPTLHCTVSLLCAFERANHWEDWQVRISAHLDMSTYFHGV